MRKVRHKWGKIGPSYLFSEHGGLSFLLYFWKQRLVGNNQGKFQKKIVPQLLFRGVTLTTNIYKPESDTVKLRQALFNLFFTVLAPSLFLFNRTYILNME